MGETAMTSLPVWTKRLITRKQLQIHKKFLKTLIGSRIRAFRWYQFQLSTTPLGGAVSDDVTSGLKTYVCISRKRSEIGEKFQYFTRLNPSRAFRIRHSYLIFIQSCDRVRITFARKKYLFGSLLKKNSKNQ